MDVLILGSGGREHALAWRISQSPSCKKAYVAPGNPGTGQICENVDIDITDFSQVSLFCKSYGVGLVVVGPENPLVDGIADHLRSDGIVTFGPGRDGAQLEASKTWAKQFMSRHGIPHPGFSSFDSLEKAQEYLHDTPGPWVIKADGLAFGKGVNIVESLSEGLRILEDTMSGQSHGEAGKKVVIEEFLTGKEVTAMAICDGDGLLRLPLAKDHKRVSDGDTGPMTGGMGAFSPVPFVDSETERLINTQVLERTLNGLKAQGIDFRGVLYAGLMLTQNGPKVLEYNVRFGDPETQCVLPRLHGDFCQLLFACAQGDLSKAEISVTPLSCAAVVLASSGYPGSYDKGKPIDFRYDTTHGNDTIVFHAGTKMVDGQVVTSGGRVLAVAGLGPSVPKAAEKAYGAANQIKFDGKFFRSDIGKLV